MTYKGVVIPGPDIDRLMRGLSRQKYADLRTEVSILKGKLTSSEIKRKKLIHMLERKNADYRTLKEKYQKRGAEIQHLIRTIQKYRQNAKETSE